MVGFLKSHGASMSPFGNGFMSLTFGQEDEYPEIESDALKNIKHSYDPFGADAPEADEEEDDFDLLALCEAPEAPEHRSGLPFDKRYDLGSDYGDLPMTPREMIEFYVSRDVCDEYRLPTDAWIKFHYGIDEVDALEPQEDIDEPVVTTHIVIIDRQATPSFHSTSRCNITKETSYKLTSIAWRNHRRSHLRNAGRKPAKWHIGGCKQARKSPRRWSRRQYWKDDFDWLVNINYSFDPFGADTPKADEEEDDFDWLASADIHLYAALAMSR